MTHQLTATSLSAVEEQSLATELHVDAKKQHGTGRTRRRGRTPVEESVLKVTTYQQELRHLIGDQWQMLDEGLSDPAALLDHSLTIKKKATDQTLPCCHTLTRRA